MPAGATRAGARVLLWRLCPFGRTRVLALELELMVWPTADGECGGKKTCVLVIMRVLVMMHVMKHALRRIASGEFVKGTPRKLSASAGTMQST